MRLRKGTKRSSEEEKKLPRSIFFQLGFSIFLFVGKLVPTRSMVDANGKMVENMGRNERWYGE